MRARRTLPGIIIALTLLLSGAPLSGGAVVDRFSDGSAEISVVIPQGGGNNSSVSIDLPRNITITNASLDIEGRPADYGLTTTVLDFLLPQRNRAWAGTTNTVPPLLPPSNYESTNITLVPGIKKSDNLRYTTGILNAAPYHLFEFFVGWDIIVGFNLTWEGIGFSDPQIGIGNNGADLYLWDRSRLIWKPADSGGMGEVPQEVTLTGRVIANAGDYIDAEGYISAFVHPAKLDSNRIETDYVKLDFTGLSHGRPFNVTLDVGADNTTEWSHPGLLQGSETFSGPALVSSLQAIVDNGSSDPVRIPLRFHADGGGVLFLSNLTVEYGPKDMPPRLKKALPAVSLNEDGASFGALDLRQHFEDDGGAGNLSFSVAWVEDPGKVLVLVNGSMLDMVANLTDWHGNLSARLRATDARGQWADSNDFVIQVLPVNDRPRLVREGDLAARQDAPFEHRFNASDPDGDRLEFSTNSTLLSMDKVTGRAAFVPRNGDVGRHLFSVTVSDPEGAVDSALFALEVVNQNDPPALGPIEDQVLTERKPFALRLNATDPDRDIGLDRLHFRTNSSMFTVTDDGLISFTPQEGDVGIHRVRATVTDDGGLSDSRDFTMTVLDVNDPPRIEKLPDLTVQEHQNVSFRVNASDPDAGDAVAFTDTTPLFDIAPGGWVNFTPSQREVGDWLVRITVTDRAGLSNYTEFRLTVLNVNDPPANVTITQPGTGMRFPQGKTVEFLGEASDEDGDSLNFTWYVDGKVLGHGNPFSTSSLAPGNHMVILKASDGEYDSSSSPVEITISQAAEEGRQSLLGIVAAILILTAACATISYLLWRKRAARMK